MIPTTLQYLNPEDFKAQPKDVADAFCLALDATCAAVGAAAHIDCTAASSGHAPGSRHYLRPCDAGDVTFPVPPAVALRAILAGGWGGVGWYPHWNTPGFHLDRRPGAKVYWVATKDGYVYGLPVLLQAIGLSLEDVVDAGPVPSDKFLLAHAFTAPAEGGLTRDKGGLMNFGISLRGLRRIGLTLGDIDHDGDIDEDDIRALTPKDAQRLMFLVFWQACKLDDLPPVTACAVYDWMVNAGPAPATRGLQNACNFYPGTCLRVDGLLGPKTRAAADAIGESPTRDAILARRVNLERRKFYDRCLKADPSSPITGWRNRVHALDLYCDDLAAKGAGRAAA